MSEQQPDGADPSESAATGASDGKSAHALTNAEINERISAAASSTSFAERIAQRGGEAVFMDENGSVVHRSHGKRLT